MILSNAADRPQGFPGQEQEVAQRLEARVNLRIHWNVDTESENNTGSLVMDMKGLLTYNETFSSLPHGMMTIMLPYQVQDMQATWFYKERVIDKNPPSGCPALAADYSDSGTQQIPALPGPGNLMAHHLGSIGKITKMNTVAPPEVKALLHDYYDFFLVARDTDVRGRIRDPENCRNYVTNTMPIQLCSIEIRFKMKEGGVMSGGVNWTTHREGGSASLGVKVSNLPEEMEDEQFSPRNEPGNVRYSLNWEIQEAVALGIHRKVNGEWKDIDSDEALKNVSMGERIELKGVVFPEGKEMSSSSWTIDGNDNRNYLKKFDADDNKGEVIPLSKEDLDKEEIVFYWYKGEAGAVNLTATIGGYEYQKDVQFNLKKPDYSVSWEPAETSRIDKFIDADAVEDRWPRANWPSAPQYDEDLMTEDLRGLRYDGILFTCSLESDTPGETQWVQLVTQTQQISDFSQPYATTPSPRELDMVYPCARNESFFDAPGIPINKAEKKGYQSWMVKNEFELYIMFRPKGKTQAETEKNEWVPVKLIEWFWGGRMQRNEPGSGWYSYAAPGLPRGTKEPFGENAPKVKDADDYPVWSPKRDG